MLLDIDPLKNEVGFFLDCNTPSCPISRMIAQNDTFENSNYITYYKTERNVTLQSLKGIRPAERLPNVKKTHWAHNLISFNQVKTF